jgi:hypothetical protein
MEYLGAAEMGVAVGGCASETGMDAFLDHGALKFGKDTHHLKQRMSDLVAR